MRAGDQVNGYIILHKIGEGGMSIVYLARGRHSGKNVAVKQLRSELASDAEFVRRFQQEASIMLNLRHPHLACALDYIERNGDCLLVEEYLSGRSLADLLKDLLAKDESVLEENALCWCRDALHAVNFAHEQGIVHRDLKPGNLMFDSEGRIKVTDFGIAKAFGGPRLTRTRAQMGTPAYMSPEQIRDPQKVYHLTDVYSMGVVLYELLTRKAPFERDSDFETRNAVVKEPVPPPRSLNPNISVKLERIILKAMHKDLSRRYGGCAEFASQIDSYLKGEPTSSGLEEWVREHPGKAAVVLLLLVVLVIMLFSRVA